MTNSQPLLSGSCTSAVPRASQLEPNNFRVQRKNKHLEGQLKLRKHFSKAKSPSNILPCDTWCFRGSPPGRNRCVKLQCLWQCKLPPLPSPLLVDVAKKKPQDIQQAKKWDVLGNKRHRVVVLKLGIGFPLADADRDPRCALESEHPCTHLSSSDTTRVWLRLRLEPGSCNLYTHSSADSTRSASRFCFKLKWKHPAGAELRHVVTATRKREGVQFSNVHGSSPPLLRGGGMLHRSKVSEKALPEKRWAEETIQTYPTSKLARHSQVIAGIHQCFACRT